MTCFDTKEVKTTSLMFKYSIINDYKNRFVALPYYIRYFVVTASINTDQGFRKLIVPQVINQNQSMKQTNQAKSTGRRFVLIKLQ